MYQILFKKFISFITLAAFLLSCVPTLYAQSLLDLPKPGSLVALSPVSDPLMLRGIKVDPQHPLDPHGGKRISSFRLHLQAASL